MKQEVTPGQIKIIATTALEQSQRDKRVASAAAKNEHTNDHDNAAAMTLPQLRLAYKRLMERVEYLEELV